MASQNAKEEVLRNTHFRVGLAAVLIAVSTYAQSGSQLSPEDKFRVATKQTWISYAQNIVNRTNDPHAIEVSNMVFPFMLTGKPVARGFKFLEGAKSTHWFLFVPIMSTDLATASPELLKITFNFQRFLEAMKV